MTENKDQQPTQAIILFPFNFVRTVLSVAPFSTVRFSTPFVVWIFMCIHLHENCYQRSAIRPLFRIFTKEFDHIQSALFYAFKGLVCFRIQQSDRFVPKQIPAETDFTVSKSPNDIMESKQEFLISCRKAMRVSRDYYGLRLYRLFQF